MFLIGLVIGIAAGFIASQALYNPSQTPAPSPQIAGQTVTITKLDTRTYTVTSTITAGYTQPRWNIKISSTTGYFEANLPVLVAIAKGYFNEEGIKVTFIPVKGGAEARKQLVAGDVDFIAQSPLHAGIAISAGADIRVVVPTYRLSSVGICVSSALKDRVKSVSDLRGMAIGISAFGSLTWAMVNYYAIKSGLDPQRDLTIVEIGSDIAAIVASLQQGKIQAYACWTPIIYELTKRGLAYTLINPLNPEEHRKWIGESSLEAGILTRGDVINKNPELVARVVAAVKKALLYISITPSTDIAKLLLQNEETNQFVGYPEEDLVKIIDMLKPGYNTYGLPDPRSWETGPYVILQKLLPDQFKPVSFEQAVDWRFSGLATSRS
ncbi:MAG: ABC transporter substrate-binding protein [Desulfurococcales archaeon]|jgi:ABC-type nitrate/sulfonate/bicarbonate transport system substrate-binding protein|nr:ABC transporter substrate-binding protein [Desulfurococcales archaeon]